MPRLSWIVLLFGLAGCPITAGSENLAADEGSPPAPAADPLECTDPPDCELVGSSCCVCPSFALPVTDGFGDACSDVVCDSPPTCSAIEPACDLGMCVARCTPIPCDTPCASGFAIDGDFGCAVCACQDADPTTPECTQDAECVQVQADCCGCLRGGQDTAVPADQAADFIRDLDCPEQPACPEVNVCSAGYVPRCLAGACVLTDDDMGPNAPPESLILCGTPESPACPPGFQCILNDPEANDIRLRSVGICRLP